MIDKDIHGCYWAINPESGDTGGWYEHLYNTDDAGWGTWLELDDRRTELLTRLWGS